MEKKKIILFDGVCNLCNSSVQFLIEQDKENVFLFSSLQAEFGQKFLKEYQLNAEEFDSIIYLDGDQFYDKSSAALHIAKDIGYPMRLLYVLIIIPKFIRDFAYGIIATNRYKWFGKKESCWLPTPELRKKFID